MSDDTRRFTVHWRHPDKDIQGVLANVSRRDLQQAIKDATAWAYGRDAVAEVSGYHWRRSTDWAVRELESGSEGVFGRITVVYAPDDWSEF